MILELKEENQVSIRFLFPNTGLQIKKKTDFIQNNCIFQCRHKIQDAILGLKRYGICCVVPRMTFLI